MKLLTIIVGCFGMIGDCPWAQGQSPIILESSKLKSHLYIKISDCDYYSFCDITKTGSNTISKNINSSLFNPEVTIGYHLTSGWQVEVGHGFGYSGGVGIEARKEIGTDYWWNLALARVPVRLYKRFPIGASRFSIAPFAGASYTFWWPSLRGTYSTNTQPIAYANPARGSATLTFLDLGHYHSIGYELGGELQAQITKKAAIGLRTHYTNSFSRNYVSKMTLEYDNFGVKQPVITALSRLEAIAATLSIIYNIN